jgi:hypothetical protein
MRAQGEGRGLRGEGKTVKTKKGKHTHFGILFSFVRLAARHVLGNGGGLREWSRFTTSVGRVPKNNQGWMEKKKSRKKFEHEKR